VASVVPNQAIALRADAAEMLRRAERVKTVSARKQLLLWAREMLEKAEGIERNGGDGAMQR
jgi:hypothetical protein